MRANIVQFGTTVAVSLVLATMAGAQQTASRPSGTAAHKPTPKRGVSCTVLLVRNGQRVAVPSAFDFRTGDQVTLGVRVDSDSYVYVLNRSFTGSPEQLAARSMALVAEADEQLPESEASPYALLFPVPGKQFLVKAGAIHYVPPRGLTLRMEGEPGVEKVLVIASPRPLDITAAFDPETGKLRSHSARDLSALNRELVLFEENSVATRGFGEVSASGGSGSSSKPSAMAGPSGTNEPNPAAVSEMPAAKPELAPSAAEVPQSPSATATNPAPRPVVHKSGTAAPVRHSTPKRPGEPAMIVVSLKHGDA